MSLADIFVIEVEKACPSCGVDCPELSLERHEWYAGFEKIVGNFYCSKANFCRWQYETFVKKIADKTEGKMK